MVTYRDKRKRLILVFITSNKLALWSQQLGFTVTTTAGTIYTHGLGYTPTVVLLTLFGTAFTPSSGIPFYTLAGTNLITVGCLAGTIPNVDVTVGSFHSLIK